jgi:hypothetical protein
MDNTMSNSFHKLTKDGLNPMNINDHSLASLNNTFGSNNFMVNSPKGSFGLPMGQMEN